MKKTFAELFKKYRLRSEFEKLSDLGNALAEKGLFYEDSIFSHWQKGNRIPTQRNILIHLIEIFIERGAINSLEEANEILESVHQGYLTVEETRKLPYINNTAHPFQVPQEIAHFTGRKQQIQALIKQVIAKGVYLIHGPSGVGKTALAIHLGHLLKESFPDGVLWYKVDTANPMDILLSIAQIFHENISPIQDLEVRASVVRSLLANKKLLLILDNVEQETNIRVLLSNSSTSVILTSKYQDLPLDIAYHKMPLTAFTEEEVIALFNQVLSKQYVKTYKTNLLDLANSVGKLPLALQIYAKQLALTQESPKSLLHLIEKSTTNLQELVYENKNLYVSIEISFQSLDATAQKVFLSLGIFEGKDFSLQAIAAINKLTQSQTMHVLQKLINVSLLEEASHKRYRLHPFVKTYIRKFTVRPNLYTLAAKYYGSFLEKKKKRNTHFYNAEAIYLELDSLIFIFEQSLREEMYKMVVGIWKNLGMFFWQVGEWEKIVDYGTKVYSLTRSSKDYYSHIMYSTDILSRFFYFTNNIEQSQKLAHEALTIAREHNDEFCIAFFESRLGKTYQYLLETDTSLQLFMHSLKTLQKYDNIEVVAYTYKFIGETYIYRGNYKMATEYMLEAQKLFIQNHDMILLGITQSMLGGLYYVNNQYAKATRSLSEAISIEEKYHFRIGIRLFCNLTLALITKDKNKEDKAAYFLQKAKKENEYLNISKDADKIFAMGFLLKDRLKEVGYYIFE